MESNPMIDDEWNLEDVPFTGKAGHIPRFGLPARLSAAAAAACLFLFVLYPRSARNPENWLSGPLALFLVQDVDDRIIGGIVATILMPLILAFLIKPGRLTAALSIAGLLAWVGFAMWL